MNYYLKRLGHQELGSVKNEKAQRGRYIYISKDDRVLDFFPPLSKTVTMILQLFRLFHYMKNLQRKYTVILFIIMTNSMFKVEPEMSTDYTVTKSWKIIDCCFKQMIF